MWMLLLLGTREFREFWSFYMKLLFLFLFICHLMITGTKSLDIVEGKGAYCTKNEHCDQTQFLECVGSACDCRGREGMIWVQRESKCMRMEGAPCGRHAEREEAKCVPNSVCIDGACECEDDYLRTGFGLCELSYGSVCTATSKCSERYSLVCSKDFSDESEGICKCRGEGEAYVWDEDRRKCVSTVGGQCDRERVKEKDDSLECIQNAECVDRGVCECREGFTRTPKGTCMLEHGQKCNNSQGYNCNRSGYMVCRDGYCACEFYGQMVYDQEVQQCRWLIGEVCEEQHAPSLVDNPLLPRCVKDAFCKLRPNSTKGACACGPGLEISVDKTCTKFKGHGGSCSASIDCDRQRWLECVPDEEQGGGRCDCFQNSMYYDGSVCRVRPGKSCSENRLCGRHSYCEGSWCVCEQGYEMRIGTTTTDCIAPVRHHVDHEALSPVIQESPNSAERSHYQQDDEQQHLTYNAQKEFSCVEFPYKTLEWERCQCQVHSSSHSWSEDNNECLALVGSVCKVDGDCTGNAFCESDGSTCQCTPGAVTTSARTCLLKSNISKAAHSQTVAEPEATERMHTLKSVRVRAGLSDDVTGTSAIIEITLSCRFLVIFMTLQYFFLIFL